MGLFDKKKSPGDSPSPAESEGAAPRPASGSPQAPPAPSAASAAAAVVPVVPVVRPEPAYGIRQAIELMRGLPGDNIDLVVHVVKKTLESMGVQIDSIVQDALGKQGEIEERVGTMRAEIEELDQEIQLRREEIGRMEADCREIILVKDRLLLAQRTGQAPPAQRPAQREAPRAEARAEARVEARAEARAEPKAEQPVVAARPEARPRADQTPIDMPIITIERGAAAEPKAEPKAEPRPETREPTRPPQRAPYTTGSHQTVSPATRPLPGATLTPKK